MTIREQRAARKELKRLRQVVSDVRHGGGTEIARGTVCAQATGAIVAARRLGFVIVVRDISTGHLVANAIKVDA